MWWAGGGLERNGSKSQGSIYFAHFLDKKRIVEEKDTSARLKLMPRTGLLGYLLFVDRQLIAVKGRGQITVGDTEWYPTTCCFSP
jgi:hypothetical protein